MANFLLSNGCVNIDTTFFVFVNISHIILKKFLSTLILSLEVKKTIRLSFVYRKSTICLDRHRICTSLDTPGVSSRYKSLPTQGKITVKIRIVSLSLNNLNRLYFINCLVR